MRCSSPKKQIMIKNKTLVEMTGVSKIQPKAQTYSADFETSTKEWLENDGNARVWAWAVEGLFDDFIAIGNDIHSFFICLFFLGTSTVYFANAKFDTSYLIDYALKAGIDNDYALCDGVFYSSTFINVTVIDSLKLLGGSIASQAKTWGLNVSKIEEPQGFYKEYRPKGHKLTDKEVRYILHDVEVQKQALLAAFSFGLGVGGVTKAGSAFYLFRQFLGEKFAKFFPKLVDDTLERASYRGGWCIVNRRYAGRTLKGVTSFDINAMYAAAYSGKLPERADCLYMDEFPVGRCVRTWENVKTLECPPDQLLRLMKTNGLYFFARVHVKEAFLKKKRVPTLQYKARYTEAKNGKYQQREYRDFFEDCDLFLDKRDFFNIFLQDYDGEYRIDELRFYKAEKFSEHFAVWANEWSKVKAGANKTLSDGTHNPNFNPGLRQIAKDMLTNVYGKFGMRSEKVKGIPHVADGVVTFSHEKDTRDSSVYVPFAVAVTSAARSFITRVAQEHYKSFVYADTDSVKLYKDTLPDEIVNDTALGFFKNEGTYERAKFLRAKTYMTEEESKIDYKCCGLPQRGKDMLSAGVSNDLQFRRFRIGLVVPKCKLIPKRVRGGVVLDETDFSITEFGGTFRCYQ